MHHCISFLQVNGSTNAVGFEALYGLWVITAAGILVGLMFMMVVRRRRHKRLASMKNTKGTGTTSALPDQRAKFENLASMVGELGADERLNDAEQGGGSDGAAQGSDRDGWYTKTTAVSMLQRSEDLVGTESQWACGDSKELRKTMERERKGGGA